MLPNPQSVEPSDPNLKPTEPVRGVPAGDQSFPEQSRGNSPSHSPIHALPDDVLSLIFEAGYLLSRHKNRLPFPVAISHVSRRWRAVAFDTRVIWSYLRLSGAQPSEYVEAFIKRSEPYFLDILFDCSDDVKLYMYLALLLPASHRWHHCSIFVAEPDVMEEVIHCLRGTSAPELKYLQLYLDPENAGQDVELQLSAPALSHFRSTNVLVSSSSPMLSVLTELFISSHQEFRAFLPGEVDGILMASPFLTKVSLGWVIFDHFTETPIEMPALQHLAFDCVVWLNGLLSRLRAPALSVLEIWQISLVEIRGYQHEDFELYTGANGLGSVCLASVETLRLEIRDDAYSRDLESSWLAPICSAFPSVTHFELRDTDYLPFIHLLQCGNESAQVVWPDLDTLTIAGYWRATYEEAMYTTFQSRRRIGCSVWVLRLQGSVAMTDKLMARIGQQMTIEYFHDLFPNPGHHITEKDRTIGHSGPALLL